MKKKPFDLDAAMRGDRVITRDGRDVTFVAYVPSIVRFPVVAHVAGREAVDSFSMSGCWRSTDLHPENEDLFMAVETKTVYANLYPETVVYHPSEKDAIENVHPGAYVIALPVEIEIEVPNLKEPT